MNINKLDHIALVKLYSTDDTDSYESKAVVAGMDETQNYILVFPAFAQYPMTFKYHSVHDRFEHSTSDGDTYYVHFSLDHVKAASIAMHTNN